MSNERPKLSMKTVPSRIIPRLDSVLRRRPAQVFALIAFVTTLALLLGPSFSRPTLVSDHLKIGHIAGETIKATHDFHHVPGEDVIEGKRRAAAERVAPVFDHQGDQGTAILARTGQAFKLLIVDDKEERDRSEGVKGVESAGAPKQPLKKGQPAIKRVAPTPSTELRRRSLARLSKAEAELLRKKFADALQVEVSPLVFDRIRRAKSAKEVRASVLVLVDSATDGLIVSHRGVLRPYRGKEIVVRHRESGRIRDEERISNFARIRDVQQVRNDVRRRVNVHAARLAAPVRESIASLVQSVVEPNTTFNMMEMTKRHDEARQRIARKPEVFIKNQVIVSVGDRITKEHLAIIRAMEAKYEGANVLQLLFGVGLFILVLLTGTYTFATQQFRRFFNRPRDLLAMGVLSICLLALCKTALALGTRSPGQMPLAIYAAPIAVGAMLVRLLVTAEAAAIFAAVLASLCGLLVESTLSVTLFYLVTSMVAAQGVANVQSRSTVLRAGLVSGLLGAFCIFGLELFQGRTDLAYALSASTASIGGGLLAASAALGLLPVMEWAFAYTTDITLLELANLNHPLLRELMLKAPGTYHHSMVVGSLAESACEATGANGLLARCRVQLPRRR